MRSSPNRTQCKVYSQMIHHMNKIFYFNRHKTHCIATMACTALARPAALALPRPTRVLAQRSLCTPYPALAAFARQMESGLSLGRRLDASAPAHNLRTRGYAVVDGLLGDAACRRMRTEAEALHAAGSYSQSYSEVAETGEKIWRPGAALRLGCVCAPETTMAPDDKRAVGRPQACMPWS
jgi:hypothetical protein